MPEIRRKHIWKNNLNEPYKAGCHGCESWSMAIIGCIIFWLVKSPKEGWIGVECIRRVSLVVGVTTAYAILANSQHPHAQVYDKPQHKQGLLEANHFKVGHAIVSAAT